MKTDVRPLSLRTLEAEVRVFERRYGLPSDRMTEVFHEGEPDADQRRWSRSYRLLLAARKAYDRTRR